MGARLRCAAGALAAVALLPGCSGQGADDAAPAPTAEQAAADCAAVAGTVVSSADRYLEGIEASSAAGAQDRPVPDSGLAEQEQEFSQALSDLRGYAAEIGCDPRQFRDDVTTGLRGLTAGGPVANAVLLQLRADTTPSAASVRTVEPGGDVAAAVAGAPAGATVELAAGEHELTETLVLLRGITLRGAGRDTTTLRSAAAGGVLLVLTAEPVVVDALTLTRPPDAPGTVVSAAPVATLSLTASRVTGARTDPAGEGGIGVLLAAGPGGQAGLQRRTTLTVRDSEVVDNAVAGVVAAGEHRLEVTASSFARNAQCGVCFLGTSDGTVTGTFDGNAAAVVAAGDARPVVEAATVSGGDIGVQALDRSAPEVRGTTVTGVARAAFLFADQSAGAVRGSTCRDVPFGVVVGPGAAPAVEGNTGCELARGP